MHRLFMASAIGFVVLGAACGGGGGGGGEPTAGSAGSAETTAAGAATTARASSPASGSSGSSASGADAKLPDDPCGLAPAEAVRAVIKSPLPARPGTRQEPQPGVALITCSWSSEQTSVPPEGMTLVITSIPAEARKSARDGLATIVRSGRAKEVSGLGEFAVSSAEQQQAVVRVVVKGLTLELAYSQRVERGSTGPGAAEREQELIALARAIVARL